MQSKTGQKNASVILPRRQTVAITPEEWDVYHREFLKQKQIERESRDSSSSTSSQDSPSLGFSGIASKQIKSYSDSEADLKDREKGKEKEQEQEREKGKEKEKEKEKEEIIEKVHENGVEENKDGGEKEKEVEVVEEVKVAVVVDAATASEILKAEASWDFRAASEQELDLLAGDILSVTEKTNNEWWFGENTTTHRVGYFPKDYVRVLHYSVHE